MFSAQQYSRFTPLFRNLVKREVRQRYKGSLFGVAWTLMNPVVVVITYSVVFNFLFPVQSIRYYPLFLFTALTAWTFFFGGIQMAASSLVSNANLVKKVRFPREIVPAAAITANAVTAGAMMVIALPLCLLLSSASPAPLVLLPVLLVALAALTLGLGLILAAINVYFRDVEHILGALGMPWFFLTPIFYTLKSLPESLQGRPRLLNVLYYGNPATPYVSSFRSIVFDGHWPSGTDMAYCLGVGAVALVIGFAVFRRLERDLAIEL